MATAGTSLAIPAMTRSAPAGRTHWSTDRLTSRSRRGENDGRHRWADRAKEYRQRALWLRQAYNKTFFLPDKNRYLWWIGQDGKRYDYINPLIQENAVLFGIADRIEADTGLPRGSRDVMQVLWDALEAAEYRDEYRHRENGGLHRLQDRQLHRLLLGHPGNLVDIPDDYNFQSYGAYEFPYYCNGCIFPQDSVAAIMAFPSAGMNDKADIIRREIFRRQHEGILLNGSGFYMGVVNVAGQCYSILKWDGTPTDYEGIISRDCSFLQSAILIQDPAHALFDEAEAAVLENGVRIDAKRDRFGVREIVAGNDTPNMANPALARARRRVVSVMVRVLR